MASQFTCRHEFPCDEETFWNTCILSEEFSRALYMDVLKFPGWKVLSQKEEDGIVTRSVQIDPPLVGLPGPVAKAVGDKFSYVQEGRLDRKANRYTFTIKPSTAGDKAKTSGELWTEKLGEGRCARSARVDVDVKIFMIGGLLEEKILGDLKKSYEETSRYIAEYLSKKATK